MIRRLQIPVVAGLLAGSTLTSLHADSVTLLPSADTYLSEHFTGPSGSVDLVIGTQGSFASLAKNHGLIQFDFSSIPAGVTVTGVVFTIKATKAPSGASPSNFHLHRVLREWSEADSTWTIRLSPDVPWGSNGGAAGTDYAIESSSQQRIAGVGTYTFPATPGLIADVTAWLADPTTNHGWLVVTEDESIQETACRFGSRDTPATTPSLVVQYEAAPELRITSTDFDQGQFCLHFVAQAGTNYFVERRDALEQGAWSTITNLPPNTTGPVTVCDPIVPAGNRFYRVGAR